MSMSETPAFASFAHRPGDPSCPCNECQLSRSEDELIFCPQCGEPIDEPDIENGELCCACESRLVIHDPFKKR